MNKNSLIVAGAFLFSACNMNDGGAKPQGDRLTTVGASTKKICDWLEQHQMLSPGGNVKTAVKSTDGNRFFNFGGNCADSKPYIGFMYQAQGSVGTDGMIISKMTMGYPDEAQGEVSWTEYGVSNSVTMKAEGTFSHLTVLTGQEPGDEDFPTVEFLKIKFEYDAKISGTEIDGRTTRLSAEVTFGELLPSGTGHSSIGFEQVDAQGKRSDFGFYLVDGG